MTLKFIHEDFYHGTEITGNGPEEYEHVSQKQRSLLRELTLEVQLAGIFLRLPSQSNEVDTEQKLQVSQFLVAEVAFRPRVQENYCARFVVPAMSLYVTQPA